MTRLKTRFVVAGLILALLLAMMPMSGYAQSSSEVFAEALASELVNPPLAGPNALELEQTAGVLTVYKAGLDVADFVAHAEFTNPEVVDGVGWDYGFQFRTTGNNDDFRVFVTSDGMWNFSVGATTPSQSAVVPGFDSSPGVINTLDLVVSDSQALFGVNGQLVGIIKLPEEPVTGDVYASTGFLGSLVAEGRTVLLTNFMVFPAPGTEATPEPETAATTQGPLPPRPIQLVVGSCSEPGALVLDLLEATYPVGEPVGLASAVVAETSFTRAPVLLADLMAAPHAIVVAESFDTPGNTIACADIGGIADELGGFVIGLTPQNDSGYAGTIFMAADDVNGATNISVFLSPVTAPVATPVAVDVETADETATVEEIVAEDAPAPEEPVEVEVEGVEADAATEGAVIEIETEATPDS
jgi:hypothetical protein